jgi:hypothetical protein
MQTIRDYIPVTALVDLMVKPREIRNHSNCLLGQIPCPPSKIGLSIDSQPTTLNVVNSPCAPTELQERGVDHITDTYMFTVHPAGNFTYDVYKRELLGLFPGEQGYEYIAAITEVHL